MSESKSQQNQNNITYLCSRYFVVVFIVYLYIYVYFVYTISSSEVCYYCRICVKDPPYNVYMFHIYALSYNNNNNQKHTILYCTALCCVHIVNKTKAFNRIENENAYTNLHTLKYFNFGYLWLCLTQKNPLNSSEIHMYIDLYLWRSIK